MSKDNVKKEKTISIDLITLMELEQEATSERILFIDLLKENLEEKNPDYRLLEMLCDGLSISNKFLREINTIVNNNPIVIPDEEKIEQVVLFPEDRSILEMIITSRAYLKDDISRIKNISSYFH